jgi:ergothioneine biosynthesis protein EgtB
MALEQPSVFPNGAAQTTLTRFCEVRERTEQLALPLSDEDAAIQSMPDASPIKWHLAHTTWFFETFLLEPYQANFTPFDPRFRVLFNSYYNGVGEQYPRAQRGLISRPDRATVLAYRRHVNDAITMLLKSRGDDPAIAALVMLGCQHEQQHQELMLTDLKHMLSKNPVQPAYQPRWPLTTIATRNFNWVQFEGGLIEIGHASDNSDFAFDNEGPRHKVWLEPFELASHPVTHGEFAAFIADGGYERPELWLSLGWDWVSRNNISQPMYWSGGEAGISSRQQKSWSTFTLHGRVPIDANTPMCHVNYFEADAYARWAGARLPREAEWELAATSVPIRGNFVESKSLHPLACQDGPAGATANVLSQMFGDVWEWTQSAYLPYPGYRPAAGAVGEYNGKFMCNQFVLRGGSCATPASHIRATYRNFFPPDAQWQFSGFRLARDF